MQKPVRPPHSSSATVSPSYVLQPSVMRLQVSMIDNGRFNGAKAYKDSKAPLRIVFGEPSRRQCLALPLGLRRHVDEGAAQEVS